MLLLTSAQTQYSGNYIYTACIACVKLSILCQYHRILGSAAQSYFRWQVRALMAIVVLWTIIIFMLSATFCIPLERFWNPQIPGGCLSISDFYYGQFDMPFLSSPAHRSTRRLRSTAAIC